jgi:hypothetical protein
MRSPLMLQIQSHPGSSIWSRYAHKALLTANAGSILQMAHLEEPPKAVTLPLVDLEALPGLVMIRMSSMLVSSVQRVFSDLYRKTDASETFTKV